MRAGPAGNNLAAMADSKTAAVGNSLAELKKSSKHGGRTGLTGARRCLRCGDLLLSNRDLEAGASGLILARAVRLLKRNNIIVKHISQSHELPLE